MNVDDLMPPDPFEQDGVDLLELETAEKLAKDGASASDPRWDRLDGPTIDEFDEAAEEFRDIEDQAESELGSLIWRTVLAGIAVVVAIALLVLVVR